MQILVEFEKPISCSLSDGMKRVSPQDILRFSEAEIFPEIEIREIKGRVYYTPDYGGFFIGDHTEGKFVGQIMKAQSISDTLLKFLVKIKNNIHYSEKIEYMNLAKYFLDNEITPEAAENFSYPFIAL